MMSNSGSGEVGPYAQRLSSASSPDASAPQAGAGGLARKPSDFKEQCATYLFPVRGAGSPAVRNVANVRGHTRSASHGGVGSATASMSSSGSAGIVGRPSALKGGRGHQRALSQGQIVDGEPSGALQKGHSRVGSRTDFILPPGHREAEQNETGSRAGTGSSARAGRGHSRQASRSESIYTLRNNATVPWTRRLTNFVLRRKDRNEVDRPSFRSVYPNHLVPPAKAHPNGLHVNNRIRTTKYTFLSFLPKNLFEQFHRVANLYFIFIILLNWFPKINAFGKEIAMIPVGFVLGVTAIKDLFEDRRRHASDKRINNSTCRVYSSEVKRYKKTLWKDVRVGDLVHLSNNEVIPADILLLRSSDRNGLCYIDTCNLDGETNLKPRQVVRGFANLEFEPHKFTSVVEVDPPTTKIYRFHGAVVHPNGARVMVNTDNLLLRECQLKNTDFVEGLVVYAGHETKAMLNNGGPRYKRSKVERQMNTDIVWCVFILIVLCVVGAVGCRFWLVSYETSYISDVPFLSNQDDSASEGFYAFWTFIIILQVMIPLSLYVTIEMTKLAQVYYIHHNEDLYDPDTGKRVECRALNITEELGQVQYIFSDKTGTLTENKMLFRRCVINGIDYSHPSPENVDSIRQRPIPLVVNPNLQSDLQMAALDPDLPLSMSSMICGKSDDLQDGKASGPVGGTHAQKLQEFLLVLAICNTVVVAREPHHDSMDASGLIKSAPSNNLFEPDHSNSIKEEVSIARSAGTVTRAPLLFSSNEELNAVSCTDEGGNRIPELSLSRSGDSAATDSAMISVDKYTRLAESRSVTPSPPPRPLVRSQTTPNAILVPEDVSGDAVDSPMTRSLNMPRDEPCEVDGTPGASSLPDDVMSSSTPVSVLKDGKKRGLRLLNVPPFNMITNRRGSSAPALKQRSTTPTSGDDKPIFEAESPDEIALVEAAYSYKCRLLRKSAGAATVSLPNEGVIEFEILQVLPFDSSRKCMSVIVRHPITREIVLYCKGADSTILSQLARTDDPSIVHTISRTQHHLNSYASQGLRVLVVAKRSLTETQYLEWVREKSEMEHNHDHREREKKTKALFEKMESSLTLLGATGIEDRLQEGVPETIAALSAAGIVIWVLTGDKRETAINIAYSARLFSPKIVLLKIFARNKDAAEATINAYLQDIDKETRPGVEVEGTLLGRAQSVGRLRVGVGPIPSDPSDSSTSHLEPSPHNRGPRKKRALVVDGKSLTYILDQRSKLQKPFLELTRHCSSVLCCRATPLQKAYIVRIVKEQLGMRTLAIGDGANDVSMIQTADIGIGISGQEGMQAVMASDFAVSRFKFLERVLLVQGHWCYHRLSLMILYFFYKNATFVFLIFWFQLYCGFSGQIMLDEMFLMLFNLLFSSLPPLAVGIYDMDAPEDMLLEQPQLYRQSRLGRTYQPHSFWATIADCLYQSIVIFFVAKGAYHDSAVGMWEFGATVTSSCMFTMVLQIAIEVRSWTIIHVMGIFLSLVIYFIIMLVYDSMCVECIGLQSNYFVLQHTLSTPIHWFVVLLSVVSALLPRFMYRTLETSLFPNIVQRAVMERRQARRRGEDMLVSWSRSTSTSSVFRSS